MDDRVPLPRRLHCTAVQQQSIFFAAGADDN